MSFSKSIFHNFLEGLGSNLGLQDGSKLGQENAKRESKTGAVIKSRFGSALGSILGRFWVDLGGSKPSILG